MGAMIIDSHAHSSPVWWEPVETLIYQMDRNGIDRAVLVQFMGQVDNRYQFDCQRRFPGRFANVVLVDWKKPYAVEALKRLAAQGAAALRLRPYSRSPGDDPLAIWRAAGALGLPVDCVAHTPADFCEPGFVKLVEELSEVRIIIEHLGGANKPDADETQRDQRLKAIKLGRFPNAYMKVPGLSEFAKRRQPPADDPYVRPIPDYLERAYTAFGPGRLMWGSDFPNCSSKDGYANALAYCRQEFAGKPKAARDLIFGGTAAKMFFP
jgi:L-fuconolactonase